MFCYVIYLPLYPILCAVFWFTRGRPAAEELWIARIAPSARVGTGTASTRLARVVDDFDRKLCDGGHFVASVPRKRIVGI
jgi:hypothetical protein